MREPNKFDAVGYDKNITEALGLTNQTLKLDASKDEEAKLYPDIPGAESIEILDATVKNERRVLGFCHLNYF